MADTRINVAMAEEDAHKLRVAKAVLDLSWQDFFAWAAPKLLEQAKKDESTVKLLTDIKNGEAREG